MDNFWTEAIAKVDQRRKSIVKNVPETGDISDEDWNMLERLSWLERFAQSCKRLAGRKP